MFNNRIHSIVNLKKLTNLRYCYLQYNNISNLNFLKGCSSIEFLDLSANQLSSIPSFIFKLGALRTLIVSNNHISQSKTEQYQLLANKKGINYICDYDPDYFY